MYPQSYHDDRAHVEFKKAGKDACFAAQPSGLPANGKKLRGLLWLATKEASYARETVTIVLKCGA
jgi:hypothetical protein